MKTNFVSGRLKSRSEMHTKDLTQENKLLKVELKKAQQLIKASHLKLSTKSATKGKRGKHHYLEEVIHYLEDIIDAIPGNVYWKTREGMYFGCNDALAKLLKLKSPEEIVGKTDYDLFDEEIAAKLIAIDRKVVMYNKELIVEEAGMDINGKQAIYLSKKIPLHDKRGAVLGLIGVSLDITERKKYEELLRREKEKLSRAKRITAKFVSKMQYEVTGQKGKVNAQRSAQEIKDYLERIITLIPVNIYWKDINGHYLFSNSKMLGTVGLNSAQDAVGKTIYELTPEETQADFVHKTDEEVMRKNKEKRLEETILDAKGNQLTFLTHKIPLHNLKGKVIGLLGVSLDITDRKKAEEKVLQLTKEKAAFEKL